MVPSVLKVACRVCQVKCKVRAVWVFVCLHKHGLWDIACVIVQEAAKVVSGFVFPVSTKFFSTFDRATTPSRRLVASHLVFLFFIFFVHLVF